MTSGEADTTHPRPIIPSELASTFALDWLRESGRPERSNKTPVFLDNGTADEVQADTLRRRRRARTTGSPRASVRGGAMACRTP
jgi:hypothetical protein